MPKRKRKHDSHSTPAHKRLKSTQTTPFHGLREHPVLSIYYSNLRTLRGYLLTRLPLQSKARRRRLLSVPQWIQTSEEQSQAASSILSSFDSNSLIGLSKLLDSTLVGWNESQSQTSSDQESLEKELELFSQQLSQAKQKRDGGAQCSGAGDPFLAQSDVSRVHRW